MSPENIQQILDEHFPTVDIPLDFTTPYTLLIAVLLSAQCTDLRVNQISPKLFALAATPQTMARQDPETVEEIIRPCGLAPTKSKAIVNLSKILVEKHHGEVPKTLKELEALPGVGHKTASVVISQAFGIPAFPVDTHIHRCAKRWGLSSGKDVTTTESDLKRLFPKSSWNKLHIQIILFARTHCPARAHDPSRCPICKQLT